ncbi:MAG: B12-binding domain-containing radical SAM protein [Methanobacterium sp.]
MKIYLLNPPFIVNGQELQKFHRCTRWQGIVSRGGTYWYPIWLSYAAGIIESKGHKVRLVDAPAWNWNMDDLIRDFKDFNPDMFVIETNFASIENDIKISNQLKNITGSLSMMVGPATSQFSEMILNGGVDVVAKFEFDFTINDVVEAIENGDGLEGVRGVSFMKNGTIIDNPERDFITSEELDQIPFVSKVYKEHLNVNDYLLSHTLHPMVQIFTGRGCPNRCTFCSWPKTLMGREYRIRSVENILDEFEYVSKEMPEVKEIFIEDDTFTIDKNRIKDFCIQIKERKLDINWSCNARVGLDYETMKLMKNAGCRLLDVGFESGDDRILKNIKKGITTEESRRFMSDAKRANLLVLADFIFGLPGETKESAEKTIQFVKEIKPNIVQFAVATPIPGTEFFDWIIKNNYLLVNDLGESIDENGFQKCIISYPDFTKEDIEAYVDKGLKTYYLSVSYIPIAFNTIFRKNGLYELKSMVNSSKVLFNYFNR